MSAVAFAILKDRVHLISDGMAMRGGQEYSRNAQKAFKVNDRCGLLWMGMGNHIRDSWTYFLEGKAKHPRQVISEISKDIKKGFEHPDSPVDTSSFEFQFWILAIGYDAFGKKSLWYLDNTGGATGDPYEPIQAPSQVGMIGSMINGFDGFNASPFAKLASQYSQAMTPEHAMRKAFDDCIDMANKNPHAHCGGQIFFETIKKG